MKGRLNTPQAPTKEGFASARKRGVHEATLPPFLDALFDARTSSGAIGGALMGSLLSSGLGAIIGGIIGGIIGFMSNRRENGQTAVK